MVTETQDKIAELEQAARQGVRYADRVMAGEELTERDKEWWYWRGWRAAFICQLEAIQDGGH